MIKISRSENFWGLSKNVVDSWKDYDYFLVLLGPNNAGWVFSKTEVNLYINNKEWNLSEKDKDYKIHPPFPRRNFFNSLDDIAITQA